MNIDDLIPPHVTRIVAEVGLHKIAGAMNGAPEMTLKEASALIGMRAYRRRKEARAIADGIAAYAVLSGEKVADAAALSSVLGHALVPATITAGAATVPYLMSDDPNKGSIATPLAVGGAIGGGADILKSLYHAPSSVGQELAHVLGKVR